MMHWLRKLWARLMPVSPATAQYEVERADRTLAELRAKVRSLPVEQQAAFAQEIHDLIEEQARARNALNDALDDRHDR